MIVRPRFVCLPALFVLGLLPSFLSGCTSDDSPENDNQIVVTGSSTIAPLVAEIAKDFEALHPGVRIDVQSGGSSRGVADARRGLADIGMVSRDLKIEEGDLTAFTIARDGVGVIVHRDNPVDSLSDDQIVAIYTNRINNWNEVGGPDAPITVVNKAEGRSTLELFVEHFQLDNKQIQADTVIGDNEQGIKTVAGNPNAIGYVSIGTAEYDATHDIPIKLLPLSGVAASIENVRSGTFPLSRPLNLVVKIKPTGLAAEFIEFARSREVHPIILEQYFVPLSQ
ncbi:Phosphate-binding protein PstS 1 precursor [Roseimaritima multifibrata]|uniref:Phosphate-binding protein PstS 1 n=1 Tax=Roseimaritima multifibrata TaxID=1930274 RepID=A0A517MI12_9BACT|nr:phosphate ABC transporter substrate-binding protein [Roseimaritima multifibrata]QDS94519.1 Phosphate-binding protein PstS 1 precursor [Roseimaritima multifibrata]